MFIVRRWYALLLPIAFLVTAGYTTAQASCSGVFCDDFSEATTPYWSAVMTGNGPSIARNDGRVELSVPATSTDGDIPVFAAQYTTTCPLHGDFDVQAEFTLLDWPFSNGVRCDLITSPFVPTFPGNPLGMGRVSFGEPSADFPDNPREVYLAGYSYGVFGITGTSDTNGTLRIVRQADSYSQYRLDHGTWVLVASGTGTQDDTYVVLDAHSHNDRFAHQDVRVAWDNVVLASGQFLCPGGPTCGNGIVESGEECDDGNTLDGDCCSSTCHSEAAGAPCTSGANQCVAHSCDGAGSCANAAPVTCPACEACDPSTGCVAAPLTRCRTSTLPFKSQLQIIHGSTSKLAWSWAKGQATSSADFGDPTTSDDLTLCLYDESQTAPQLLMSAALPAGDNCGTRPCWKGLGSPAGSKGYKRTAPDGTADGITGALLKPGDAGKASVKVKGKGALLATPALPLSLPVLMQLQSEAGACWESRFYPIGLRRNDATQFKGTAY